jgi:hypothetical protein
MQMNKAALAVGLGAITAGAALTIALPGQQAHAGNTYYGGAGQTYIQTAGPGPTAVTAPKAVPSLKAQPFVGGNGPHG